MNAASTCTTFKAQALRAAIVLIFCLVSQVAWNVTRMEKLLSWTDGAFPEAPAIQPSHHCHPICHPDLSLILQASASMPEQKTLAASSVAQIRRPC